MSKNNCECDLEHINPQCPNHIHADLDEKLNAMIDARVRWLESIFPETSVSVHRGRDADTQEIGWYAEIEHKQGDTLAGGFGPTLDDALFDAHDNYVGELQMQEAPADGADLN